jgi:hypothetical protein
MTTCNDEFRSIVRVLCVTQVVLLLAHQFARGTPKLLCSTLKSAANRLLKEKNGWQANSDLSAGAREAQSLLQVQTNVKREKRTTQAPQ